MAKLKRPSFRTRRPKKAASTAIVTAASQLADSRDTRIEAEDAEYEAVYKDFRNDELKHVLDEIDPGRRERFPKLTKVSRNTLPGRHPKRIYTFFMRFRYKVEQKHDIVKAFCGVIDPPRAWITIEFRFDAEGQKLDRRITLPDDFTRWQNTTRNTCRKLEENFVGTARVLAGKPRQKPAEPRHRLMIKIKDRVRKMGWMPKSTRNLDKKSKRMFDLHPAIPEEVEQPWRAPADRTRSASRPELPTVAGPSVEPPIPSYDLDSHPLRKKTMERQKDKEDLIKGKGKGVDRPVDYSFTPSLSNRGHGGNKQAPPNDRNLLGPPASHPVLQGKELETGRPLSAVSASSRRIREHCERERKEGNHYVDDTTVRLTQKEHEKKRSRAKTAGRISRPPLQIPPRSTLAEIFRPGRDNGGQEMQTLANRGRCYTENDAQVGPLLRLAPLQKHNFRKWGLTRGDQALRSPEQHDPPTTETAADTLKSWAQLGKESEPARSVSSLESSGGRSKRSDPVDVVGNSRYQKESARYGYISERATGFWASSSKFIRDRISGNPEPKAAGGTDGDKSNTDTANVGGALGNGGGAASPCSRRPSSPSTLERPNTLKRNLPGVPGMPATWAKKPPEQANPEVTTEPQHQQNSSRQLPALHHKDNSSTEPRPLSNKTQVLWDAATVSSRYSQESYPCRERPIGLTREEAKKMAIEYHENGSGKILFAEEGLNHQLEEKPGPNDGSGYGPRVGEQEAEEKEAHDGLGTGARQRERDSPCLSSDGDHDKPFQGARSRWKGKKGPAPEK
ncbi:hypothetical protein MKZ38_006670 [Zalerion maritima]|uniref:Uncharacterized protein n=1 Tax=Zalerion maritima TaxID=339359 RepID=A0AAD5WWS7_9PEZI|nr:hypothetical protein MKZ38_006670 [Zalerion maritima]